MSSSDRGYQANFSALHPAVGADRATRQRKAQTIIAILADHFGGIDGLRRMKVLDVGGSNGVIDATLANVFAHVTAVDIDEAAVRQAQRTEILPNLEFRVGDAMALEAAADSVDVAICAHVYEHVPDAARMMAEIRRVLRPGGVCYFAAGNRFQWMEPHYRLPLLSVIPSALAHLYLRVLGRGEYYYERHFSWWGLRRLAGDFALHDYTRRVIDDPVRFETAYMLPPGSLKHALARAVVRAAFPFVPTYLWLLEKPR